MTGILLRLQVLSKEWLFFTCLLCIRIQLSWLSHLTFQYFETSVCTSQNVHFLFCNSCESSDNSSKVFSNKPKSSLHVEDSNINFSPLYLTLSAQDLESSPPTLCKYPHRGL